MRIARASGWRLDALHRVGSADDDAGLRAAEQLVAREADQRRAGLDALAGGRLVDQVGQVEQRARAEVVDQRDAVRGCQRRPARGAAALAVKPTMRKFDWWTRSDARAVSGRSPARSRRGACGWSSPPRPAARRTGRGCRGSGTRRRSRSARRGRSRPRHRRPARPGTAAPRQRCCSRPAPASAPVRSAQQRGEVVVPRSALAGRQVVFERRVAGRDLPHPIQGAARQRRAAEVRVHDHAGRVQHRPQAGRP